MNSTANETNVFQWIDYTMFSIMLVLSAMIGIYFALFGKKQDSPEEYLHGGKKMKILPIVGSLIASDVSGIAFLALPSDVYAFGSSYNWSTLSGIIAIFAIVYLFIPVLCNLPITSSFEYLDMRYSRRIRTVASVIYTIINILLVPIIIYTAILAFVQVSQVNMNVLTVIVCMTCTGYTILGGIKAVVWTDTLQMCAMLGSFLVFLSLGIRMQPGGFKQILETSLEGGRLDLNLDFDPTSRTASFTVIIGTIFVYLSYGYNPIFVQRYLSLPTVKKSKLSAQLLMIGLISFRTASTFFGLIIYSRYSKCDPVTSGSIKKLDQLVPYYITDMTSSLPGLPGIFIAGIFCASISTMSTLLHTSSGLIYEDIIKNRMPANTTKKRASDIIKITVGILGILTMLLVFVVQHLGEILELFLSVNGVIAGPVLAMFTLGMLVPYVNEKGIFYGSIVGASTMLWIATASKYYAKTGQLIIKKLPVSTDGCLNPFNITITSNAYLEIQKPSEPFYLYRISFLYYTLMGFIVTTIIALPVSWFTRNKNEIVDVKLFSPFIRKFVSKYNNQIRKQQVKDDNELDCLNQKVIADN